jgi:SWI/SNF-related matrix-associated actin-dependent regulator 1 of chromatin subfamily A
MLKTKLYPYQVEGVRRLREQNGIALLADEVGLGKTLQSSYYAWRYLPSNPAGPIVVVCPAYLKINWQRELTKHLEVQATILRGERVPSAYPPPSNPNGVFVLNYEILVPPGWEPSTTAPPDSWIRWLANLRPRLLILDEGHLLSNHETTRARAARWLARRTPRRMVLTGTPLPNQPPNLWSILNLLWPKDYPSHFDFCSEYSFPYKDRGRWVFKGARNLPALHKRLSERMIRRRKCDVLSDLPPIRYEVVPLECELNSYKKSETVLQAWLASKPDRASQAEALARIGVLTQSAVEAKVPEVKSWILNFLEESGQKLLVGVMHYTMTDRLRGVLGRRCVVVDGRVPERRKVEMFDRFNRDPEVRVLLGNIQAAGTGWSCTATSDVVFAELPWRPSDVTQFAGRVHGVGRGVEGQMAQVRFLVAAGTIEETICEAIQRKQLWASAAVDGVSDNGNLDLVNLLMGALMQKSS